jgi:hypothetical protein
MITHALTVKRSTASAWIFLLAGLLILSLQALASEGEEQPRVSRSIQGLGGRVSLDEFEYLVVAGDRVAAKGNVTRSKTTAQAQQAPNVDFWFYTADVQLFNDHDADGYFHGIDLLFDADTYFAFAEVYAVFYLSLEGGPWNEYAATDNFSLFGATGNDDYVIVTELLAGYPSGSYDILIELFDADDNSLLAYFGPDDTSELAFLPLEDADRDIAVPEVIVIERGGGGSSGYLLILLLALAALGKPRGARFA